MPKVSGGHEQQMRELVDAFCSTLEASDRGPLLPLLSDKLVVVAGLGEVMDRDAYLTSLDNFEAKKMRPRDLRITLLCDAQVAICTGTFEYLARRVRQQAEFEPVDLFHTIVWSRESGDWQILVMQGTRIPFP